MPCSGKIMPVRLESPGIDIEAFANSTRSAYVHTGVMDVLAGFAW
jgi:hypothetical protein